VREGRYSGESNLNSEEEESKVTCAFTFNNLEHLSLVVSLEGTPLDCTKCCDTVNKPILGLLVYCVLSGPIKIIQSYLVHFIPEIPIAFLDLVFSSNSNPPYIFLSKTANELAKSLPSCINVCKSVLNIKLEIFVLLVICGILIGFSGPFWGV